MTARGPHTEAVTPNPDSVSPDLVSTVVGVDVGGTDSKAVLVDRAGRVLAERVRPTPPKGPDVASEVVDAVAGLVTELSAVSESPVGAVGLVVPGIVDDERGVAVLSENLGWQDIAFRALVAERTGLPTAFGHDVRAGGLAESRLGAARGLVNVVFLPIGTGIAAALVLDGRVYSAGGYAGEIGHIDAGHAERCACGLTGCLEVIGSAAAIARRYTARTGRGVRGAADVARALVAGDPDARIVWDEAVDALAMMLAWTAGVLAPEAVVIGGGLSSAGDLLFTPLAERLAARLTFQRVPRLVAAELGGWAGCRGAALLAFDAVDSTP